MNELKELYSHIENPIDNKIKWNKILNIYSTAIDFDDFFSKVVEKKEENEFYFAEEDKADFYLMMWSEFKKKLLSIPIEQIKNNIINKIFDSEVYDVIKKLNELDSIKNFETLKNTLSDRNISNYFSKIFYENNSNFIICSDFENIQNKKMTTVFTVTVQAVNLYKFLKVLLQKIFANEIPYILKYNEKGYGIIIEIFVDIDNSKNIESILNILKKENYSFFNENTNNLLYGNVNKWISIRTDCDNYLSKRSHIIFESIDRVVYEYVLRHLNIVVSYKDGKMSLIEYIANGVMEKIITNILESNIKTNSEMFQVVNSDDLVKLKEYIRSKLLFSINDILNDKLYLKNNNEKVSLVLNSNKIIGIDVNNFLQSIRNLTFALILKDNTLEKAFKVRIENACFYHKIDSDKFCLDNEFSKQINFDTSQYNKYKKQLDEIHEEIFKLNNLENLIKENATKNERKEILDNMHELLDEFNT